MNYRNKQWNGDMLLMDLHSVMMKTLNITLNGEYIYQTRAKPGATLHTPLLLINSVTDSVTDPLFSPHSFTAPPRPNG